MVSRDSFVRLPLRALGASSVVRLFVVLEIPHTKALTTDGHRGGALAGYRASRVTWVAMKPWRRFPRAAQYAGPARSTLPASCVRGGLAHTGSQRFHPDPCSIVPPSGSG